MDGHAQTSRRVIVLGDHDTGQRADVLADKAAEHGAVISEIRTFDLGEVGSHDDLAQVDVVVTAVGRAIRTKTDIWAPFPMQDLGREQHVRRLSLVLQRHGLNLLMGSGLWPCPTTGGMNEADFALRKEVQAVDDLDDAALAAVGFKTLGKEIELALAGASAARLSGPAPEHDCGPSPGLPAASAAWRERRPALKRYATCLVCRCGLTQADAAKVLNGFGQRTPQGRMWQQATVSALINGRYDRPAAA
jgi:hypothetical protein